jgi:hypothetical protein
VTRRVLLLIVLGAAVAGAAASVWAQPPSRHATNIPALLAYPGFFHLRPVLIVGKVETGATGDLKVSDEGGSIALIAKNGAPDGVNEVRGELWDLGRFKADDPRLNGIDIKRVFHVDPEASWPRPGEALAFFATTVAPASAPTAPSIRAIVLNPARYLDQKVTIVGQYEGRNLAGDLPDAPGRSKYVFVLRAADAAIWVSGIQPKGKGFDLSLDRRIDTGRWLQVTGTLQQGRGLQWLVAEAGTLEPGTAPSEAPPIEAPITVAPAPPPEVIFSAPTADETDVPPATKLRIQFSRDIDAATLRNRVRAHYVDAAPGGPAAAAAQIELTTDYVGANRELVVAFKAPLARLRRVQVEILDGVLGTDKQPLKPWSVTFETGG